MFETVEYDLGVVRPPRLLVEIDMIIKNILNIAFISSGGSEIFLKGSEVIVVPNENSLFAT